jgi:hypothetical protein
MDRGIADIVVPTAIAAAVVGCAWVLAWAVVRSAAINAKLKEDMLERGLSVEEMERLLNPYAVTFGRINQLQPGGTRHTVEEDLAPLLDRELSVDDIERLLKRLPGFPPFSVERDLVPLLDRGLSVEEIERLLTLRRSLTNEPRAAESAPAASESQTSFKSVEPRSSH